MAENIVFLDHRVFDGEKIKEKDGDVRDEGERRIDFRSENVVGS